MWRGKVGLGPAGVYVHPDAAAGQSKDVLRGEDEQVISNSILTISL